MEREKILACSQQELFQEVAPKLSPFELFASRIKGCPDMPWASLVCDDCGHVNKKSCTKLSCLSPFCQELECIKNRGKIVMAKLKSYKINSRMLLHIIFGFAHVEEFTKEVRAFHQKTIKKIQDEMKRLGTPLQMIICRDLNGKPGDLYIHYHSANLPVKDWRKFRSNLFDIQKKLGCFSLKFVGYRNRFSLFKYFSKRVAGVFQNACDDKDYTFGYDKLMDVREFFRSFYKIRKIKFINLSPRAKPDVLASLLDNCPKKCDKCGSKNMKIVPDDMLDDFLPTAKPYPPPDYETHREIDFIPVIKVVAPDLVLVWLDSLKSKRENE